MISTSRLFSIVASGVIAAAVGCAAPAASGESEAAPEAAEDALVARFTKLSSGPSDAGLKSFYKAAKKFEYGYLGAYRFNRPGAEATDPAVRMNRVKEVMHRYMCTFFDDGIDLGRNTGDSRV